MLEDLHFRWTRRARVLFPGPDRLVDLPRSRIVHVTFCPASRICVFSFGWDWITSGFSCQAFSDPIYLFQVKLCFPTFIRLRCTRASSFISGIISLNMEGPSGSLHESLLVPPADTLGEVQMRDQVSRPAWPKSAGHRINQNFGFTLLFCTAFRTGIPAYKWRIVAGHKGHDSSFSSQSEI